eukprot:5014191-Alexandrium_andersonii.AAC.2
MLQQLNTNNNAMLTTAWLKHPGSSWLKRQVRPPNIASCVLAVAHWHFAHGRLTPPLLGHQPVLS